MAQYHVGCGIAGIYAGTLKKSGNEWLNKNDVTNEAISAVMMHMLGKVKEDENSFAYMNRTKDGRYLRLKLEVADHKPEWLEEN